MAVLRFPAEIDGKPAWPAKYPASELAIKKEIFGELKYAQQYLINPIALSGTELSLEWLSYFDPNDYDGGTEFFYGVDPSISGKGDHFVICVASRGEKGRVYIEEFIRERAKLDRMIELLERTALIYKPTVVNVEASAGQEILVQDLQDRTPLPIRSYYPGKMNKQDRIRIMAQVYFQSKKALLKGKKQSKDQPLGADPSMEQFVLEWIGFPRMDSDDTLDAAGAAIDCALSSGAAASVSSDAHSLSPYAERMLQRRRKWGMF